MFGQYQPLISAKMRYLNKNKLEVKIFIEVVMVLFLRKLIVLPEQDSKPAFEEVGIWVSGEFLIGLLCILMLRFKTTISEPKRK